MSIPAKLREQAINVEKAGDLVRARSLMVQAVAAAPQDAKLLNSAGVAYLRWGEPALAADHFAQARAIDDTQLDYVINESVALGRMGRHGTAARLLAASEHLGRNEARYWSARGNAERQSQQLHHAQISYDRALRLDGRNLRALHGRARVALERGQRDAVYRFERAIAQNPGESDLWLGKAHALNAAGEPAQARDLIDQLLIQLPDWIEGLKFLSELRLAAGESDYAAHFAKAVSFTQRPDGVFAAWISTLAGFDRFAEASDVAARARQETQMEREFALLEAVHAGAAGQHDRAAEIFAKYETDDPDWQIHRARHAIRKGEIDDAERRLAAILMGRSHDVSAWALRDVCWRLTDDVRHEWLHGQEGLYTSLELSSPDIIDEARSFLSILHDDSSLPLGQSVRGGTQTRGGLFQREEPALAAVHKIIFEGIEDYRGKLPSRDRSHPLLRHRDRPWRIAHSWSIRLRGAGYHTSHIHPKGIVSSALYVTVPKCVEGQTSAGTLEIGRPPPDLGVDLPPLHTITPVPGRMALFPSTLYHGTQPFPQGERMSVAFDIQAGEITFEAGRSP